MEERERAKADFRAEKPRHVKRPSATSRHVSFLISRSTTLFVEKMSCRIQLLPAERCLIVDAVDYRVQCSQRFCDTYAKHQRCRSSLARPANNLSLGQYHWIRVQRRYTWLVHGRHTQPRDLIGVREGRV